MSTTTPIPAVSADPSVGHSSLTSTEILSPAALSQDQTVVSNPADLRLVIEEDKAAGSVIYKTVDWRTGEVVQQLPREQVLLLRETQNYAAGKLLATEA
jgi:flagellar protein FlaG